MLVKEGRSVWGGRDRWGGGLQSDVDSGLQLGQPEELQEIRGSSGKPGGCTGGGWETRSKGGPKAGINPSGSKVRAMVQVRAQTGEQESGGWSIGKVSPTIILLRLG